MPTNDLNALTPQAQIARIEAKLDLLTAQMVRKIPTIWTWLALIWGTSFAGATGLALLSLAASKP